MAKNYFETHSFTEILNEGGELICLAKDGSIHDAYYYNGEGDEYVWNEEHTMLESRREGTYTDFEESYIPADSYEGRKSYFVDYGYKKITAECEYEEEPMEFWSWGIDSPNCKVYYNTHGINTDEILLDADWEGANVSGEEGITLEFLDYIPQDYPLTEYREWYRGSNGKIYERTSPFFTDEQADVWEIISEEEYNNRYN